MNKRQAAPYGFLLIVFLLWIYFKPQEEPSITSEHHPSYIAYNLENTRFDEFGDLTLQIYSSKATSYSNKNITLFENIKVVFYLIDKKNDQTSIWQVTSEEGTLEGSNKLILSGNVWVKNLSLDQLVQTMNTEELTILLAEKELSSKLLVKWQGPQIRQQGVGMWASLVSEEFIVKKQVKAIYLNENK